MATYIPAAELMASVRAAHTKEYTSTSTKHRASAAPEVSRPVKRLRIEDVIAAPVRSTVPATEVKSRKRKASAIEDQEAKPEEAKRPRISSADSVKHDCAMMGGQKPVQVKPRKISGGRERKANSGEVRVPSPKDVEAVKPNGEKLLRPADKQQTKPDEAKSSRVFNGIINHENNCFFSSIIQLMDAAFDGTKVDELLGEVDKNISFELPELTPRDVEKSGVNGAKKIQKLAESKLGVLKAEVKATIDTALRTRNLDTISIAKHLRNLIDDLRRDSGDSDKQYITAYTFQQLMAFGCPDNDIDADTRRNMTGATQQDCFELYTAILDVLEKDQATKDAAGLTHSFTNEQTVTPVCKSCNHKSNSRPVLSNFVGVRVPKKGPADLAADQADC